MNALESLLLLLLSGAAYAQPADIGEPKTLDEFFRVDPATGELMPLEVIKVKNDGTYRSGFSTYLVGGPASTVSFPSDEPHVFAIRRLEPPEKQLNGLRPQIEPLVLQKGRRYASKESISMDVKLHGQPAYGLDKDTKKKRPAYPYLYWPKEKLPPGEYALTWNGAFYGDVIMFTTPKVAGGAFRIVETRRTPAPTVAPPPVNSPPPVAPPTAAAPAISAAEIARLRRAADQGDLQSQVALAQAYAQLFRRAAEQGQLQAQANLGNLYFTGRGVVQDYVEAHKWLNIAAARLEGDERKQTTELRDKVGGLLTAAQMADAQKRAVDWSEAFQKRKP